MNVDALVKKLNWHETEQTKAIDSLVSYTEAGKAFASEDLYAYEYSSNEDVFAQSLEAWSEFLSFAVDVDKATLSDIMRKYQGTLQLKPHSDTIANFDEVVAALKNANPSLEHYLRLSSDSKSMAKRFAYV